jgi:hypothetical protein
LLAPSMSANANVSTMPRSAVAMLLESAIVRFRRTEPECCWACNAEAVVLAWETRSPVVGSYRCAQRWCAGSVGREGRPPT